MAWRYYNVLKAFRINGRAFAIGNTFVPKLYAVCRPRVRALLDSVTISRPLLQVVGETEQLNEAAPVTKLTAV